MKVSIDLHTHTVCSDGMLTPETLVKKAHECGIQGLSITDHDTVAGLHPASAEAGALGMAFVSGVELSVRFAGRELHLLGYFFDHRDEGLLGFLDHYRSSREERAARILEKLQRLGVDLDVERIREQVDGSVIGRPHIARALVAAGVVDDYESAFFQFLRNGGPADVEKELPPLSAALGVLHEAGGIGVLAHPGHWVTDRDVRRMMDFGLDGVEIIHPAHDETLSVFYENLARELGLFMTGGSDYHGMRPGDATNLGRFGLSEEQYEALRCAVELAIGH